jgi:hypothetical protein
MYAAIAEIGASLLSSYMASKNKGGGSSSGGDAQGYLGQIPAILKNYFQPYSKMTQDPAGLMNQFGSTFKQSPGYKYQLGQEEGAIGQSSAAGGMAGSPEQQIQSAQAAGGLANQDYYNYLNHVTNLYTTGARGYSQLGEDLSSNLMNQSQLANLQAEQNAKSQGGLMSSLGMGASSLMSMLASKGGSSGSSGGSSGGSSSGGSSWF